MNGPLAHLDALERALSASRFPAMSAWWRTQLARFYSSGRRQFVLRVGRRGGKSSTLCRVAVLEALYGEHVIPPGDVGIVGIVSVSRDEASQRLRTVKAILDALGVAYKPLEGGIELVGRPIAFKVFAASISGVVGGTWICALCDEVARWRDADTGANPAKEVLASLRPTMATMPSARIFLSSSPLSVLDAHYESFERGEDDFQLVAYAPTWVAHPALTEVYTHTLEPDDRVWRREYLALPQASALGAFDANLVERAVDAPIPSDFRRCNPILVLDPSAGAADTYAMAIVAVRQAPEFARWLTRRVWSRAANEYVDVPLNDPDGKRIPNPDWTDRRHQVVVFEFVGGFDNLIKRGITSEQVVGSVIDTARRFGAIAIHSDQFERFSLASAIGRYGHPFVSHAWTAPMKERAVERVRQWLADGMLVLPKHDPLRRQMLAFEEVIAPSGAMTFRGRRGGHDDYALLVLLAALVDIEGQLPGSALSAEPTWGTGATSTGHRLPIA